MPAGLPYFAWIDASETVFTTGHLRWDEDIFSFTLSQEEGDPASLTLAVRRPRNEDGNPIGLLGPGRKIWCWFALDCGVAEAITFRGRLVGIPTSLFEDLVTLEFVARPVDVVAQKEALAASLRVLPFYDPVVLDPARRTDPEVVLEGYTKIWHYARDSHVITVSDEILGEDGLVEFDGISETGKVLYDGLGLQLTGGPLSRVEVAAEFSWTLQASGSVDLTHYLISNWPESSGGAIRSYTMGAGDWPKNGSNIGDGWEVASSSAHDVYDYTAHSITTSGVTSAAGEFGLDLYNNYTRTYSYINAPYILVGSYGSRHVEGTGTFDDPFTATTAAGPVATSSSASMTWIVVPEQAFVPTLVAGYSAERPYTERVSFTLTADVQHILTDPEDGEALRIDDIKSVNLSEPLDGQIPIGDVRRRSYIATERGNQSLEHLIVLARAHLMKRARVVEIAFAPKLARMPEITLRKNAVLSEPRIGEALGKIIGYSIALDGSDGRINCEVRIGCTIGRGGEATESEGGPIYASIDYTGADYQQFVNRVLLLDTSVGYEPPSAAPNDDGLEMLAGLGVADVIESGLVVAFPKSQQASVLTTQSQFAPPAEYVGGGDAQSSPEQQQYFQDLLASIEMTGTFKLKSMTAEFSTDYDVQVTDLQIPVGYDLEAE